MNIVIKVNEETKQKMITMILYRFLNLYNAPDFQRFQTTHISIILLLNCTDKTAKAKATTM